MDPNANEDHTDNACDRLNGKLAKKCFKMLQNVLFNLPLSTKGS